MSKRSEEGYILLGVMILLAVFVIGLAFAAPRVAASIQRDREVETMRRGKQYIRAIQLYYRKFNAYPPSIDALVKTNEIRFLRKRYIDPITGKDDWKPIMYCQNKAPIAMGFFGQPLGPTSGCGPLAGTGPSGGNGINGAPNIFGGQPGQPGTPTGGTSPTSQTPPLSGGAGTSVPTGTTDPTGSQPSTGTATGTTGSTDSSNSTGSNSGGSIFGNSNDATNGQTLGGGGIMGVSPPVDKKSLLVYKKKDHYNQWEFTYSTLMDQMTMQGGNAGTIGTPAGGLNGGGINGGGINGPGGFGGAGGGIGSPGGGSGPGGGIGPGSGTPPTSPQPTPPPQQ